MQNKQTLQTYPCDYTFKVFGTASTQQRLSREVYEAVVDVVDITMDAISDRSSSGGKYFCISVNARLQNEEQRRRIYVALQDLEGVRYLL